MRYRTIAKEGASARASIECTAQCNAVQCSAVPRRCNKARNERVRTNVAKGHFCYMPFGHHNYFADLLWELPARPGPLPSPPRRRQQS